MTDNKNIIKDNNREVVKAIKNRVFYATIEIKSKSKEGTTVVKSFVGTHKGSRLEAKIALNQLAKSSGGEISYFGAFKN